MFCGGILGFFSGLVFNKNDLDRKKSDHFRVMAGPVTGVLLAAAAAWIDARIRGGGFFGWRLYLFGAAGMLGGFLIQRKRLPVDDITLAVYGFRQPLSSTEGL